LQLNWETLDVVPQDSMTAGEQVVDLNKEQTTNINGEFKLAEVLAFD
jgi:hypothetical protein